MVFVPCLCRAMRSCFWAGAQQWPAESATSLRAFSLRGVAAAIKVWRNVEGMEIPSAQIPSSGSGKSVARRAPRNGRRHASHYKKAFAVARGWGEPRRQKFMRWIALFAL